MIPRQLYDSDHEMFRDSLRKFLEIEAMPDHEQWESDGMVSDDIWLKAGEQGFNFLFKNEMSEQSNGMGIDWDWRAPRLWVLIAFHCAPSL